MSTELVDISNDLPAIHVPLNDLHRIVLVGHQECRGGISWPAIEQTFTEEFSRYSRHYLSILPQMFQEFDMQNAQECVEHLRLLHVHELMRFQIAWYQ